MGSAPSKSPKRSTDETVHPTPVMWDQHGIGHFVSVYFITETVNWAFNPFPTIVSDRNASKRRRDLFTPMVPGLLAAPGENCKFSGPYVRQRMDFAIGSINDSQISSKDV